MQVRLRVVAHGGELGVPGDEQVDLVATRVPHAARVDQSRTCLPQSGCHGGVRFGEQTGPAETLLKQLRIAVRRAVVGAELDEVALRLEVELIEHPEILENLTVREMAHRGTEREKSRFVAGMTQPMIVK